jgi:hypothetical protein
LRAEPAARAVCGCYRDYVGNVRQRRGVWDMYEFQGEQQEFQDALAFGSGERQAQHRFERILPVSACDA